MVTDVSRTANKQSGFCYTTHLCGRNEAAIDRKVNSKQKPRVLNFLSGNFN